MIHCHQSVWRIPSNFRHIVNHQWDELRGTRFLLIEEDNSFHLVIKDRTRRMSYIEIKRLELEEFKNTSHLLSDDKLMESMMNRMELEDHKEINVEQEKHTDLNHEILRTLSSCSLLSRKLRSWFTSNQIKELKKILDKFPGHQTTIRKFLKISKTSFHRLKQEIKNLDNHLIFTKRLIRENNDLSLLQKVYVRQLVKPPTVPLTLNEI